MSLISQALAAGGTIGVPQPTGMKITDIGVLISRTISVVFIVAGIITFAFLVLQFCPFWDLRSAFWPFLWKFFLLVTVLANTL